jgi:hypothetical protein
MKLLSILTIACLLASAASLALPASTVQAEEDPLSWHVNACIGSTCPPDTVGDLEFAFDGEQTTADMLKGKIVCTGMGCTQTVDVYYLVTGEVSWGNMYDFGARTMTITTNGQATPIECGSGLSGHCYFHSYGMIEGGDINADPATAYHVITTAGVSPGATGDDVMLTINITYSTNPIRVDECDTDYMDIQFVVEAGTFDADSETGVSQTLQAGLLYRLTVTGGPWQPEFEGENRWDSAIQLGEDDWRNTNDLAGDTDYVECFQHDPDNVHDIELVFTAPDADFSIRANDLVGEFADNLGMMNYSIAEVQLSGGGCAGQFLPGTLIANTTLAGTNSSGLNLHAPAYPLPGRRD